jgi:hypothetical protein
LISFLMFSSPVRIFKAEVRNFNDYKTQHNSLNEKNSKISKELKELVAVEEARNNNPSPGIDSIVSQYIENIHKLVANLRSDSANSGSGPLKSDLVNHLTAYNAVLFYTGNSGNIKSSLPATKNTDRAILNSNLLQNDNARLKIENQKLSDENSRLKIYTASAPGSNDAAKQQQQVQLLTQLQKDKDACTALLLKATTDVQAKDLQLKDREIKISQLTEKPNNTNPVASLKLSEEDKASLIYQSVDMAIKKCKYSDDIGMALINILQNIQGNYSNKAQLDNKIKEIKKRIGQTF